MRPMILLDLILTGRTALLLTSGGGIRERAAGKTQAFRVRQDGRAAIYRPFSSGAAGQTLTLAPLVDVVRVRGSSESQLQLA